MALLPTPEDTAREILAIFVLNPSCRPDDILGMNNFNALWHKRGLKAEDFEPGMQHAAAQGWVEILQGGTSFRITKAGYGVA